MTSSNPFVPCRIELLGTLRLICGGETLTHFPRQKAAHILAFLALRSGHPQTRERLIDLFWPEMDLPAGRDSLSTTLSALRRLLEPAGTVRGTVLQADSRQVGLNPAAVTTDAADFERLLADAHQETEPARRAEVLTQAIGLVRGEALDGIYDDWVTLEADRLHRLFVDTLRELTSALEDAGNWEEARRTALRWVAADEYAEEAHLRLISLQAQTGYLGDAQLSAKKMARLWLEEFGAALPTALQSEIAEILATKRPDLKAGSRLALSNSSHASTSVSSLPIPLDTFFGREMELAWLTDWMSEGGPRLVTLLGSGGMGKTRLALDFAGRSAGRFTSFFVSLAEIEDPAEILPAIVRTLSLTPDDPDPIAQVGAFFASLPSPLLIMDNLEQLLIDDDMQQELGRGGSTARLVQLLLQGSPHLFCLCTSRLALSLRGERLIPVDPLPLPPEGDAEASLQACASIQLYVDRARAVRPDFNLSPANAPSVAAICRLLDGNPLALELAASWVRLLPPRAMWKKLSQQTGMIGLEARHSDVPARHHSLRAALDWSWRLLKPAEQRLLARLSVFRGGWTLEAAEAVCLEGACSEPDALSLLSALLGASLLRAVEGQNGETRYSLLETVRQYAAYRLAESVETETAQNAHGKYFLTLAEETEPHLFTSEAGSYLTALETEHDNLRVALIWFQEQGDAERSLHLVNSLARFWQVRGYFREGGGFVQAALSLARAESNEKALALFYAAALVYAQGNAPEAIVHLRQSLEVYLHLGNVGKANIIQGNLGGMLAQVGEYAEARRLLEEVLPYHKEAGQQENWAATLGNLGDLARLERDYGAAVAYLTQSMTIWRRVENIHALAVQLNNLARVTTAQGDLLAAGDYIREAVSLRHEMGDIKGLLWSLDAAADLAAAEESFDRAVRLGGAGEALRATHGIAAPPSELAERNQFLARVHAEVPDTEFSSLWAQGRSLTLDEAVALVLADAPTSAA